MSKRISILTLIFTLFLALQLSAQTLDDILKKYYEARGGYEKIKSVKTMKATGKQLVQNMEVPFTIRQKRPNMMRVEATLQGQTIVQAYDGETAWTVNPLTGSTDPQTLPKEQTKQIIEMADIDGHLVDYKEKGNKVELLGKEEVEGTETYKLKVTLKDGDVRYDYLDAEYYLELKVVAKIKRQDTEIELETYYSDYKPVDGLMLAHSFENRRAGNVFSQIILDKIELNVPMDDSIFKLPQKSGAKEAAKK